MQKIKGFRIDNSEVFTLGENLNSVLDKLKDQKITVEEHDNKTKEICFEDGSLELCFNDKDELIGFIDFEVDGYCKYDLGIEILTEYERLRPGLSEFITKMTDHICNLFVEDDYKHFYNGNQSFFYGSVRANGVRYITQATATQSITEVVALIREDYIDDYKIIHCKKDNDKEQKVDLTKIAHRIINK